jgi:hypothetical protein
MKPRLMLVGSLALGIWAFLVKRREGWAIKKPQWLTFTRTRVIATGGSAVVIASALFVLIAPDGSQRAFRRIQPGMTEEEVSYALGGPALKDYDRSWYFGRRREQWPEGCVVFMGEPVTRYCPSVDNATLETPSLCPVCKTISNCGPFPKAAGVLTRPF